MSISKTPSASSPNTESKSVFELDSLNHGESIRAGTVVSPTEIYPTGPKLAVIMIGLCLAIFCVALDNTIIATAIPRITDDFHALQDVGWYGSAYLLTTCAFQLFYGKLYSRFNIKAIFLAALFIFEVGSLVCATAQNSTVLIVGRAIAGLGAAGLFSGGLIIIAHSSPVHKRPVYTGIAGAMFGIASVVGPLLGGAFTDKVTWRWCFYINLVIGGVTAVVIIIFLHLQPQPYEKLGFLKTIWNLDPIGTLLFVPSIVCLLVALQWGGTTYAWKDGRIIILLIFFVVLLIAFIGVQLYMGETATVPPRIATQRTIAFSSLFSILLGGAFFLLIYFLPIWFQAIKGTDALHSGIDSIPLVLTMTFGIIFSGGMTTKFGHYMPYVYVNVVLTSIGTGLIITFTPNTETGNWIGYQIIFGFGCGLAFQIPQIAAQAVLPLSDVAQGVSITFFAEVLGGAIFVSVGNNILNNRLVDYIGALNIPSVDPETVVKLGATQLRAYVPPQYVAQTVAAYNQALVKTYQVALILACLSALGAAGMEWKSVHQPFDENATREERWATLGLFRRGLCGEAYLKLLMRGK